MKLIDNTLWDGQRDKVRIAIERLQAFEPPEGYYLAFSGGKDSVCIKALADMAGVQYDAHYSVTTVDPPELVRFIREHHPDVIWDRPDHTMWELIVRHRTPPTRLIRYCCQELKEDKGMGRTVVLGVRWAESRARSTRQMVEPCKTGGKRYVNPIIDWTDADVWQFIRGEGLPYCSLYDEGFTRLGCVLCPMQNTRGMERDAKRWPRYRALYVRAFDRMLAARKARGMANPITSWTDGASVYRWWVYNPPTVDDAQEALWE